MLEPYIQIIQNQTFTMLPVEGGTFLMGSPENEVDRVQKPQHWVNIPSFFIGKYLVTQSLWKAIMGEENRFEFPGDDHPVEKISWEDINKIFLFKLNHLTGIHYRLPTEAEWEYAARGGKYLLEDYKYSGSDLLKEVGWFSDNSENSTKPVGLKNANQLGIFDMSGNVYEWCEDDWLGDYIGAPADGSAWIEVPRLGTNRIVRGGSWGSFEQFCTVFIRRHRSPGERLNSVGFRLAISMQDNKQPRTLDI